MKAQLIVNFIVSGRPPRDWAMREIDIPFLPQKGMRFEQSVWENGRVVSSFHWNVDESKLYIYLEEETLAKKEDSKDLAKMYQSHDWKTASQKD